MNELLDDIYKKYSKDIYIYFYGLSRDPVLSEDLTSNVFLEAVKTFYTFREDSSLKTWLFSIARHVWCRYLREKKADTGLVYEDVDYIIDDLTPEKSVCDRALLERADEIIKEQPERTQRIIKMRMQGFSYYEIGLKIGISENSARVIEFRLKNKIKEIFKKEGLKDE